MLRFFKRLFLFLLAFLLLVIAAGSILVITREDQITARLIAELNKELTVGVEAGNITIRFFRNFPNLTAHFSDVFIASTPHFKPETIRGMNPDTLLFVRSLSFSLNSLGLLKRTLVFNRLTIRDGVIHMAVDQNRNKNYEILSPRQKADSSGMILNVKQLVLKNIRYRFTSIPAKFLLDIQAEDMKSSYRQLQSVLNTRGNLFIHEIKDHNNVWIQNQEARIDGRLYAYASNLNLEKFLLRIGDLKLAVDGGIKTSRPVELDLNVESDNNDIPAHIMILPELIQNKVQRFSTGGQIAFTGNIKGRAGYGSLPDVQFSYTVSNGSIKDKVSGVSIENIFLNGTFTGTKITPDIPGGVSISRFTALFNDEEITGTFQLKDFNNPFLECAVSGTLSLDKLNHLLQFKHVERIGGNIHTNVRLSGRLKDLKGATFKDLEIFDPVGHIELHDVFLKTGKSPVLYSSISGSIMLGKHLWLDNVALNINDNPVSISGEVRNVLSFINGKKEPLLLKASLHSPSFDLNLLLPERADTAVQKINRKIVRFPENIVANIDVHIQEFKFFKFEAENFQGLLFYEPGFLFLDSLSFISMQGNVSGNGIALKQTAGLMETRVYAKLDRIDITDLFYSFNDFGQQFISRNNIKGRLSGDVHFYSEWTPDLKIIKKSIITDAAITIENGHLIQFEPIQSLSRYIAVSELGNIRFSTLENEILIKDEMITIPQMDIESSAFNITASGTHHFNNRFHYKIKVLLSEILATRAKKAKKENTEFGIVEDNGPGGISLFLKIDGETGKTDVSYDQKEMIRSTKEHLKMEAQTIGKIIINEFRTSGKDSAGWQPVRKKKKFFVKWEEADSITADTVKMFGQKNFNIIPEEMDSLPDTAGINEIYF